MHEQQFTRCKVTVEKIVGKGGFSRHREEPEQKNLPMFLPAGT